MVFTHRPRSWHSPCQARTVQQRWRRWWSPPRRQRRPTTPPRGPRARPGRAPSWSTRISVLCKLFNCASWCKRVWCFVAPHGDPWPGGKPWSGHHSAADHAPWALHSAKNQKNVFMKVYEIHKLVFSFLLFSYRFACQQAIPTTHLTQGEACCGQAKSWICIV